MHNQRGIKDRMAGRWIAAAGVAVRRRVGRRHRRHRITAMTGTGTSATGAIVRQATSVGASADSSCLVQMEKGRNVQDVAAFFHLKRGMRISRNQTLSISADTAKDTMPAVMHHTARRYCGMNLVTKGNRKYSTPAIRMLVMSLFIVMAMLVERWSL